MKLISVTAIWCPSCIVMNSRLEKIKIQCPWLEIEEYNYDKDLAIRSKYNIGKEIPVFIFIDSAGFEFHRLQGEIDRKDFIKLLEENKDK